MTIETPLLEQVAAALAEIDFASELEQIERLESEKAEIEHAIQQARSRIEEIGSALHAETTIDAVAVADTLIATASPAAALAASVSRQQLEEELAGLRAALKELVSRDRLKTNAIADIQAGAKRRLAPLAQPVAEMLAERAREAAEQIVECCAGLMALNRATGAGALELRTVRNGAKGLFDDYSLATRRREIPVGSELLQILAPLREKGAPLPLPVLQSVPSSAMTY